MPRVHQHLYAHDMQVIFGLRTGLLLCLRKGATCVSGGVNVSVHAQIRATSLFEHGNRLVRRLYGEALAEPIVFSPPTMEMIESGKYVNDEDECVSGAHNCDPQAICMNTPGLDSGMSACSCIQRNLDRARSATLHG